MPGESGNKDLIKDLRCLIGKVVLKEMEVIRMNQKALLRLEQVRQRNAANPNWKNNDLYRFFYKEEMYIVAYEKIKSNKGSLTKGTTDETLDGFSLEKIQKLIQAMQENKFEFAPSRRILIPKPGKKTERPLGIPNPIDKVVQEVIRMILEAIYDSSFSNNSHGFRPNRSCHSALRQIEKQFDGIKWAIEGDIKGAYDNIHHGVLINLLRKRIQDERFLSLISKALKAGYLYKEEPVFSLIGTPQGSIVSPILANIYLHELDVFVEAQKSKYEETTNARKRQSTKIYNKLAILISKVEKDLPSYIDPVERAKLVSRLRHLKIQRTSVQSYQAESVPIRIRYVRYADDWIVGINGPRKVAELLKKDISNFLRLQLKLELSEDKTSLTYLKEKNCLFLGYEIRINSSHRLLKLIGPKGKSYYKRTTGNFVELDAPIQKIISRLCLKGFCTHEGKPLSKRGWTVQTDEVIVQGFNYVLNGLMNYYSGAHNQRKLIRIQYILQYSCACTLANRHQTSITQIFKKHGPEMEVINSAPTRKGKVEKRVKLPLRKFNRTTRKWNIKLIPRDPFESMYINRRTRTKLGEACCICGCDTGVQMHHIRSVKDALHSTGFNQILGIINRKQIPVCKDCHLSIHSGKYDGLKLSDFSNPKIAQR